MASDRKNLGLMDIFVNPMKVTLKQFFKSTFGKPTTVMYPLEKRDPPPTYRGMNAVIWDLCIGCGICGEVCPNKCLKMKPVDLSEEEQDKAWYGSHVAKKKNKAERPAINFGHCMFCGFCEDYCPTGAMTMTDFYDEQKLKATRISGILESYNDSVKICSQLVLPQVHPTGFPR